MPEQRCRQIRLPRLRWARLTPLAVLAAALVAVTMPLPAPAAVAAPDTYTLLGSTTPAHPSAADSRSVELGVLFSTTSAGWVSGVRFYKGAGNSGPHTGTLWSSTGTSLATASFTSESASGWQVARFPSPVKIAANTQYTASYHAPAGRYAADLYSLSPRRALTAGPLTATQGTYTYASGRPTSMFRNANYYVDVVFTTSSPTSSTSTTTPPSSTSTTSTTTRPTTSTTSTTSSTAPSGACASSAVWSNLVACGWPGPSSTGYPAGQAFARTVTGGYVVTTDNTVIDGWRVSGGIQVRAKNVTIRNSWITSDFGGASGTGTVNINPGASATVEHSLLDGLNATHSCIWHAGSSMTATANNCQGVNDGIFMWATTPGVDGTGDNFTIQDNYLHSFTTAAANGHVDGIQTEGAKNGVIRHNTLDVTQDQTSALSLWNSRKSTDNVRVEHNLLAGGGFTVYAEDYSPSEANPSGGYSVTNVVFQNNVFSTVHYSCVGYWGVWYVRGAPTDGWKRSGNVVLETGQNIDNQNPTVGGQVCN